MTLNEVIGIKSCDIDIKTGEKISHTEKYTRVINALGGLDVIIPYIPFKFDTIKNALEEDQRLNNTALGAWDRRAEDIRTLCARAGMTCTSLSERVCILKEAARQWVRERKICE